MNNGLNLVQTILARRMSQMMLMTIFQQYELIWCFIFYTYAATWTALPLHPGWQRAQKINLLWPEKHDYMEHFYPIAIPGSLLTGLARLSCTSNCKVDVT